MTGFPDSTTPCPQISMLQPGASSRPEIWGPGALARRKATFGFARPLNLMDLQIEGLGGWIKDLQNAFWGLENAFGFVEPLNVRALADGSRICRRGVLAGPLISYEGLGTDKRPAKCLLGGWKNAFAFVGTLKFKVLGDG